MPSLIDIRRRIRSVKNTQQITKAMKMVSAAKLRRAQERALASRPYADMMNRILSNVAAAAAGNEEASRLPLLQVRDEKRVQVIVVSSDRGLAGAFNANLLRRTQRFIDERGSGSMQFEVVGRKGRDYFRRRGYTISGEHLGIIDRPNIDHAREIANKMIDLYSNAETDAVYIAVNEFKSVMAPNIVLRKMLPVEMPEGGGDQVDYIYEQSPQELLSELLPRYVEMSIYRAMLESNSAEHGARMTAMDTASSNAGDVIQSLTLNMNRVRQAAITREIIEIVSGAAAL
ncbi:MAG: ATP synthase F1 subunit gamma [Bryobacteraceae bacterium]